LFFKEFVNEANRLCQNRRLELPSLRAQVVTGWMRYHAMLNQDSGDSSELMTMTHCSGSVAGVGVFNMDNGTTLFV
jgi:hypothetical protein